MDVEACALKSDLQWVRPVFLFLNPHQKKNQIVKVGTVQQVNQCTFVY